MPLTNLFRHADEVKSFSVGTVIFEQGATPDCMYVVKEGTVSLSVAGDEVETVQPGGCFGEMALIEPSPRSATATAASDAVIVPVDEKRFEFLVQQTPFFAVHVMRVLADRLRRMNARMNSAD